MAAKKDKPEAAATTLESTGNGMPQPTNALPEAEDGKMMAAQQVIRITAPEGPRRRAGFAFDKVPVDLTLDDLGEGEEAERKIEALRADPKLRIEGAWREIPIEPEAEPT